MPDYRLFRFDPRSGLATEEAFAASGDAEARLIMQEKCKGADCELWLGTRLVDVLSAPRA
jgi:hypothetical protein